MKVSILICTYGDPAWGELAWTRAYPSTVEQGAYEILVEHDAEMYLDEVRNMTAGRATGDWLCFLDADDELAPGYLAAMQNACPWEYPELLNGWTTAPPPLLAPKVSYVRDSVAEYPIFPNRNYQIDEMNHCVIGTLVHRRLFNEVGGFPAEPIYEDWAFFLACLRAGSSIQYVDDAVYIAHHNENSRNNSPDKLKRDTYRRIQREHRQATQ